MTTKHTAGPWVAEATGGVVKAGERTVALVYSEDGEKHRWWWECGRANTNLIAAAPDLLEALERTTRLLAEVGNTAHTAECVNHCHGEGVDVPETGVCECGTTDAVTQARAALAKAKGETP